MLLISPRTSSQLSRWAIALLVFSGATMAVWSWTRSTRPQPAAAQQGPRRTTTAPPRSSSNVPARPASSSSTRPAAPSARDVVAVVNSEAITRQHLAQECLRRYGADMLESMVNKQLILAACQQQGIEVTAADVEAEIQNTAAKIKVPVDQFLKMLEQERDMPAEKYRREIVWPMLALQRLAAGKIEVTDEEVQLEFEAEYGPKVRALLISARTRAEAEAIRQQCVAAPERFGDLAKEHSIDPNSAAARGVIPPIRKHVGYPEIEDVAFAMKEGEISPVIEVANQFLILKCEQQLPATFMVANDVKEVKDRLVERIRYDKLRNAAGDLLSDLQKTAKIANVYNDPQLREKNPGVAAFLNGKAIPLSVLADECVAYYGREVLQGEINRKVITQALERSKTQVTRDDMEDEILRAADAYGYLRPDGTPDREAWLKSVEEEDGQPLDIYQRDVVWPSAALKKLVSDRVEVSEEDLQKGFVSNYGERVEVQAIVCANQRHAVQVWEQAKGNNTEEFFGQLAFQNSIEPMSKSNYGKVPPIRRYSGHPQIEEEAFRLKPGELSGVVASGDKFIVMRCLGRTKPVVTELTAVKDELSKDIREKKLRIAMNQEMDRIYSAAQIDNFLEQTTQLGDQRTPAAPASTRR